MLRTITLSLLMLITFGAMLPLDNSEAYGIRQNSASKRKNYRRHSRAWWRRYRARMRRKREAALAAMAHRQALLAPKLPQPTTGGSPGIAPKLPAGWSTASPANSSEIRFSTGTNNAGAPGQASLAVVAQSRPVPAYVPVREQRRMLAGINVADLRRIVIDKMLATNGWVTNDYQREVNGYRVFIVTAQTPSDARTPEKSWNFYFTEVNGRIYSLTTNTAREFSERLAAEAEAFIASLHANTTANTSATTPTPQR